MKHEVASAGASHDGDEQGGASAVDRDLAGRAETVLQGVLDRMGLAARAEARCDDGQIVLEVTGPDAAQLVGQRGEVLDALQSIVSRMVGRDAADGAPMVVDADGYRARRAEALVQLALRLRDEAIRSGRIVALNPMSARDRRVIHMTLREQSGVSTRSEGDGLERRLLIVPDPQP